MNLQQWAERVLRVIEQDGASCFKVQLLTSHDGQVWESWHAPFPEAHEWAVNVESYLRSLENEWPARQVSVVLVATTKQGEVLSQLPLKVTGKSRTGALDSVQAASHVAFDGLASTIEKLTRLTNTQLDHARKQLEIANETNRLQYELLALYRQRELADPEPSPMATMLGENMPKLLAMGELMLQAAMTRADKPPKTGPTIKTTNGKGKHS